MTRITTERKYSGRVLDLDVDTVKFPDGSIGQLEMIRHPGAAAVVPFVDPPGTPGKPSINDSAPSSIA